jgi:hypothetical protein
LQRPAELVRGACQAGLLDDGDKGLKIADPAQSNSPDFRDDISD